MYFHYDLVGQQVYVCTILMYVCVHRSLRPLENQPLRSFHIALGQRLHALTFTASCFWSVRHGGGVGCFLVLHFICMHMRRFFSNEQE